MKKNWFSGFTLIEMLVTMALIIIIAAMLYPSLSKAQESGRNAKCSSNLRQLQLASMNYACVNNTLPDSASYLAYDRNSSTHKHGWVAWATVYGNKDFDGSTGECPWYGPAAYASITNGSLWDYAKGVEIYLCPSFAFKNVCGQSSPMRSYSMITNMSIGGAKILEVQGATTVIYCDDNGLINDAKDSICGTNEVGAWHRGKGNVVYMDGHIEKW